MKFQHFKIWKQEIAKYLHIFICSGVTIGDNCLFSYVKLTTGNPRAINEKGELASENDWKIRRNI